MRFSYNNGVSLAGHSLNKRSFCIPSIDNQKRRDLLEAFPVLFQLMESLAETAFINLWKDLLSIESIWRCADLLIYESANPKPADEAGCWSFRSSKSADPRSAISCVLFHIHSGYRQLQSSLCSSWTAIMEPSQTMSLLTSLFQEGSIQGKDTPLVNNFWAFQAAKIEIHIIKVSLKPSIGCSGMRTSISMKIWQLSPTLKTEQGWKIGQQKSDLSFVYIIHL